MQLHSADVQDLAMGQEPARHGPFQATVRLRMAVPGDDRPSQLRSPGWVRLAPDQSSDWEAAAVLRGIQLRETWADARPKRGG